jgi:polyhydroxyalkanoate synthesis regulator phasin
MSGGGSDGLPFVQKLGMVMSNLDSMRTGRGPIYDPMSMMKYAKEMKNERMASEARTKKNTFGRRFAEKAGQLDQYEADPDGYTDAVIATTREEEALTRKETREQKLADEKAAKLQAKIDKAMEDGTLSPQEAMSIDSDKGLAALIDQQKVAAAQKVKDEETRKLNEAMFGTGGGQPAVAPQAPIPQQFIPQASVAAQMQEQQQLRNPQAIEAQVPQAPVPQQPDIRSSLGLPSAPYVTDAEVERVKAVYAINPEAGQRYVDDLMKNAQFRMETAKQGESQRQYEEGELDEDAKIARDAKLLEAQIARDAKLLEAQIARETGIRREARLEPGFAWVDPSDPSKGSIPIKGGAAEAKIKADEAKVTSETQAAADAQFKSLQAAQVKSTSVINAADRILAALDASDSGETLPAAGLGSSVLSSAYLPTAASQVARDIEILRANEGFDTLQAMRADVDNKTGGALGSITELELYLLQTTRENLNQYGDPAELKRGVTRLKNLREDVIDGTAAKAIALLKSDPSPEKMAQFDEVFGPGLAKLAIAGSKGE